MHEECGVFGIFGDGSVNPVESTYLGLFAMQHRGQESCGIAVSDMGVINCSKGMGLVGDVFNAQTLSKLSGQNAIGHVRYSTSGSSNIENAQPLVMRYAKGRLAVAHNGNLVNSEEICHELAQTGAMFRTNADSEVIAQLIAKERLFSGSAEAAVSLAIKRLRGAFSIVVMSPRKLIAARDPFGFRPLLVGKKNDNTYIVCSESCALDAVGAEFVRDIEPGEVVVIDDKGMRTYSKADNTKRRICIFEYIYFARPDSVMDGVSIHASRAKAGALLARQHPVDADIVIGVPDSGLDAALGYSRESGIEYAMGFVRNNYVGRTFIKPTQGERRSSVAIKLNVITQYVKNKRVIMVDDSIVRGTTCADIVHLLKAAGASEVHVRIASPTIHYTCRYGTDIPTREELTSNYHTVAQLAEIIGADSLGFLDKNSLCELVNSKEKCFCDACFTGDYPQL